VDESKNAKLSEQVPGQHNACFGTFNSLAGYLAPGGAYHPTDGFFGAGGPGRLAAAVKTNCWIFTSPFFDPSDPNSFFQQFVGDPVTSPFLQFIPQPFDQKFGDDRLTYTLNVRYEVADRTCLYGGYSQGFKSGGFNLDVSSASGGADPTFRSEKVDAFELGLKSRFLGGRAWANIALFHTNLKDFQVLDLDGTRFNTFNTDKALSTGVEIESGFDLSDAVTLNLAGSYTDARYPSDCASFDPTDPNFTPAATSLCGTRLTNAPELVLIGGLDFNTEIGNAGMSVFGGATVRYESKRRTSTRPTELPATAGALTEDDVRAAVAAALPLPQDIQPGNTKVDLRFGFGAADGQFTIEAWARNVFDTRTRFVTFNIPLRGVGGSRARGAFVQEPRTYGVTARAKF
jgi:outer membrane receptor protein involved in Fe transport